MKPTIKDFDLRLQELKNERSGYMLLWGELAQYHTGRKSVYLSDKANAKVQRNTKQYNNTSRLALRTLASGMMAGITSPAREWFKLKASDPSVNEVAAVKIWLHQVQVVMNRVFSQSNLYNALHSLYAELGAFGTGAMGVNEDFNNVIHCKTFSVGSYFLGIGASDTVDTFYREYYRTVGQLIKEFGIENVSNHVKEMWNKGNTEAKIECVHAIEPNDDRNMMSPFAKDMPFRSVYYEKGRGKNVENKFLRESGFPELSVLCPRWDIIGEAVYSEDCPGVVALGDTKALQLGERRMYQALDKVANPPLQGDSALKNQGAPKNGEITWLSSATNGIESIYKNYNPNLEKIIAVQDRTELRIKRAFYEDLFLMLANTDRRQITAREVAEKHEEKLLMLGPVLERLHSELLDPLITRTFSILQRNGVLPIPPEELQDGNLAVDYVSVLAQAQQMVGLGATERVIGFVAEMSSVWPEARHKIDPLQTVDDYANAAGASPMIVRPDEQVAEIIGQEQQAAQEQAAMERSQMAMQTAKTASDANPERLAAIAEEQGL